jgi:hypothetical protein
VKPPSSEFDEDVNKLAAQYGSVAAGITILLAGIAGAPTPDLTQAQQRIRQSLTALLTLAVSWVNLHVPKVYRSGVEDSLRAIEGVSDDELRAQVDEAMKNVEHQRAMQALAESLRDDLQGATEGIERDANKTLNRIRQRNVQQALSSGSPLQPVEAFSQEIRDKGIGLTDKAGRRWGPEQYAAMSLRTHVATILNVGHINKALEMGSLYVKVFDGGPGDVDEPCQRANGQIWHVSHAIAEPLEHPNCRRSFAALDKDYSGKVDRSVE